MHTKARHQNPMFEHGLHPESAAVAILVLLLFLIFLLLFMTLIAQPAQAQSYHVIYTFDTGQNAWDPAAGLSIDPNDILFGSTVRGGGHGDCPPLGGGLDFPAVVQTAANLLHHR